MDNDNLKEIFNAFEPNLAPSTRFMSRLERNLDSVEYIRRQNLEAKARSKRAVAIAAAVGFATGVIFSFALPYVGHAVSSLAALWPKMRPLGFVAGNYQIIAWIITGCATVFTSLNAYHISLSMLGRANNLEPRRCSDE